MAKADNKIDIFLNEMLSGKSQRQSYYVAYPNSKKWKPETVDNKAYVLMSKGEIRARYNELLEANRNKSIITREELLRMAVKGLKIAIGEEYEENEIVNYMEDENGLEKEIKKKSKYKGTDLKSLKGLVEVIGKMEGFITDKVETKNININSKELSDDDLVLAAKKMGIEID